MARRERTYNATFKLAATPTQPMAISHIFRIMFVNQGKVYEIYARRVSHGELFGFIEVEDIIFGERATVVVDPAEERIKGEFDGVKRTYLPCTPSCGSTRSRSRASAKSRPSKEAARTSRSFPCPCIRYRHGQKVAY